MVQFNMPVEPTIDDLLSDPIVQMLMKRDGLGPEAVWACVGDARKKLRASERPTERTDP